MKNLEEIKTKVTNADAITPFSKNEVEHLLEIIEQYKKEKENNKNTVQELEKELKEKEEEVQRLETELMMLR